MSLRDRIDVVVPGPEGSWIGRALREAGLEVREVARAAEDAGLVVLATSVEAFEARAAELARSTRVVAVGWDPLDPEEIARLGLVGFLVRPVALGQLTRLVRGVLERPPTPSPAAPASNSASGAERSGSERPGSERPGSERSESERSESERPEPARREPARREPGRREAEHAGVPTREPTLQLAVDSLDGDVPSREPTMALEEAEVSLGVARASAPGSSRPPPAASATSSGTTGVSRATACFAPRLEELLRRADRRLFPDAAPLDLRFPGGDEPAQELVPDELLAEVSTPLDPAEPDPLEAFTFVGAPDAASVEAQLIEGSDLRSARERSPGTGATGRTPGTVRERSMMPSPGPKAATAPTSPTFSAELTREGTLAPGGALRLLWQLQDRARPLWLHLDVAGGPGVRLGLRDGKLVAFEGPAHRMVVAELRQAGRWRTAVDDETAAETLLREAVQRGALDRFELASRLRRAREALVHEAATSAEAQFALRPSLGELPVRPGAVARDGARRRIGPDQVLRWLGHLIGDRLVLLPSFSARAEQLGLEPELVEAFEAAADQPLLALLHGLPTAVGAAGVLFALASCDALRIDASGAVDDVPPEAVRALVRRARERAEAGSYFAVLESSPEASERELREAHGRLRRELLCLDLDALGLEELEGDRQEALAALEEALDFLSNQRLRAAYAAALVR